MIIGGVKLDRVVVTDPDDKTVAVLTDGEAKSASGYKVRAYTPASPGPDAIAHTGDILFYEDEPEKNYAVSAADEKFFIMLPIIVNKDEVTGKVTYDFDEAHRRVYPNNVKAATLEQLGLVLKQRSSYERGCTGDGCENCEESCY